MTVQDTDVIDLLLDNPKTGEVLLATQETREWGDNGELIPEVEGKINTYLEYVREGYLAAQYPDCADKPVRFELGYWHEPGPRENEFFARLRAELLEKHEIKFSVNSIKPWWWFW
jgi:hypothetical protein